MTAVTEPPKINNIAPELTQRAPLADLLFLQGNYRKGDRAAIREILTTVGQLENLVVNIGTHTGRRFEILGGNNRAAEMLALGWTEAAVSYVDLDDITARKAAVQLNRLGDLAQNDERALTAFLAGIAAESSLDGTGYTDAAYEELVLSSGAFADPAADFLNDLMDRDPEPELFPAPAGPKPTTPGADEGGKGPAAGYVTVSFTVLPDDRDIIRQTLQHAQRKWQTGTAAAALITVCDEYNRANDVYTDGR